MNTFQPKALLAGARKSTSMTTTYSIKDGPIVDGQMLGERIRVTRIEVVSHDNGYVSVDVKGKSVTKTGKDKSSSDYFYASNEVRKTFVEALLDLVD